MIDIIQKEIEDLHSFFQSYFLGKINKESISRFEGVLSPSFTIITPQGNIITRDQLLKLVDGSHSSRRQMKIWIENIEVNKLSETIFMATYNELQSGSDKTSTNRISSAIFEISITKIKWLHVHETWV